MRDRSLLLFVLSAALVAALVFAGCGAQGLGSSAPAAGEEFGVYSTGPADGVRGAAAAAAPGLADELWVIARDEDVARAEADELGGGALAARVGGVEVPVPLEHTDVRASIAGFVASVDVTQRFANPFDVKIEAVYRFPLPEDAAVHGFVMRIGERTIRGVIREREEAEQIYLAARAQGHVASLLSQERPNVFTQAVANVEPGRAVEVDIRYLHTLRHDDGWWEFRFPMVVGPRYNPPATPETLERAAAHVVLASATATGSADEPAPVPAPVPHGARYATSGVDMTYLKPHERSGHDVSLAVRLDAAAPPLELGSPSHAIEVAELEGDAREVRLRPHDSIPNRDFVLRWRTADERARAALFVGAEREGGERPFALLVVPPASDREAPRRPVELVLVLDRSGSMAGENVEIARRAARRALAELTPADTFRLVTFADDAQRLSRQALPATERHLADAIRFLDDVEADGGTQILVAIESAFDAPADDGRQRCVVFLTDGLVGNEADVLRSVAGRLGDTIVFSFGIGHAANHYLTERLAALGRGAATTIGPGDDAARAMRVFVERVTRPALADVAIDFGAADATDVYPSGPLDLYAGRPIVVTGLAHGPLDGVRLRGREGARTIEVPLVPAASEAHPGVGLVWARRRLMALHDDALVAGTLDTDPHRRRVLAVALAHGLLSSATAFIAVDSTSVTAGDHGITVPVPVPVPEGIRYDTTVGGR